MGEYDFFEKLQQLSTRNMHITIENYLKDLKHTANDNKNSENILLGATRIAYILGFIDKTTASYYHHAAVYKWRQELGPDEYVYWLKNAKIKPLPLNELKTITATKAKEIIETYINSLLDVMGKINTSENFYYVIDGVTRFAVFIKLMNYKEMAKYSGRAYVKDGTNFRHY